MKNFYIAITIEENKKFYSYALKVTECDNILSKLNSIKNIKWGNICKTKKQAKLIAENWNYNFKQNGTYLLDNESLF